MRDSESLELGISTFFVILLTVLLTAHNPPRLVGYGCAGANGPIYAYEESDFPPCLDIHPTEQDHTL